MGDWYRENSDTWSPFLHAAQPDAVTRVSLCDGSRLLTEPQPDIDETTNLNLCPICRHVQRGPIGSRVRTHVQRGWPSDNDHVTRISE